MGRSKFSYFFPLNIFLLPKFNFWLEHRLLFITEPLNFSFTEIFIYFLKTCLKKIKKPVKYK